MREVNPKKNNSQILLISFFTALAIVTIIAVLKIALNAFLSVMWLLLPLTLIIFAVLKFRDSKI